MKAFRIETIKLNEDEEVAGVTAVVDAPYLPAINASVYDGDDGARVVRRERGDTELWVELDAAELVTLFQKQGQMLDDDPLRVPGAYDSLSMVVYQLMED